MSESHDHSNNHYHSHHHHRDHHHGHGHGHTHGDPDTMMGQDQFDNDETAKTWVTDPMVSYLNDQLANVFYQKFQDKLDPQHTSVLDFGCGTGHLTKHVCKHVSSVTGVDVSKSMVDMYNQQNYANSKGVCLNMTEMHPHHLEGRKFDFIVSFYVLHHVEHPEAMVKTLASYLKPGGVLIFGEFVPLGPSHFFEPGQLTGFLETAGLEDVSEDLVLELKPEEIPKSNLVGHDPGNLKDFLRIVLGQGTKNR